MPDYIVWPENVYPQTADLANYGIAAFDVTARDPYAAAKKVREEVPELAKQRLAICPSRYVVFARRPLSLDMEEERK